MRILADIAMGALSNPNLLKSPLLPADRKTAALHWKTKVRNARRYILDEDMTRAAVRLGTYHPDVLLRMLRRARTPHQSVWLEWDVRGQIEEAGGEFDTDNAPPRTAVLVERLDDAEPSYRMTAFDISPDPRDNTVIVSPFSIVYHLIEKLGKMHDGEGQRLLGEYWVEMEGTNEQSRTSEVLMGSAFEVAKQQADSPEERAFLLGQIQEVADHAAITTTPKIGRKVMEISRAHPGGKQQLMHMLMEEAGTFRIAISILALLNASDRVVTETPWRHVQKNRLVGGNIVPFLEHMLVTLKLPRKAAVERTLRSFNEAIPKRRHEVDGHWRHRRGVGDPSCEHVFAELSPTREKCVICGFDHWFVNEHMRGTAELGFVTRDRLVTR